MTEAEIREAHAAIVERDACWIRMINAWGCNEKQNRAVLIWPTLNLDASAPAALPTVADAPPESSTGLHVVQIARRRGQRI